MSAADASMPARPSRRVVVATFAAGFFSLSLINVSAIVVPLWALTIGASPLWIGIIVGMRSAVPLLYTIRGGVLMDRYGTRRVLLAVSVLGFVATILHPALPYVWAVLLLQTIAGIAYSTTWVGAQTQLSKIARGDAAMAGRFNLATTLGTFFGPLAIGAAWDHFGPWGGFGVFASWFGGMIVAALLIPRDSRAPESAAAPNEAAPPRSLRHHPLVPDPRDFINAFRLMAIPVVAICMGSSLLRSAAFGVQHSFYPVFIEHAGMTGTELGVLISVGGIIAGLSGLIVGPLSRRVAVNWLLFAALAMMAAGQLATPFLDGFGQFFAAMFVFGIGSGINLPVMIAVLARSVGPDVQGLAIGLRIWINMAALLVTPAIMGVIAEFAGVATSFYWMCGGLLVVSILATVAARRMPGFDGKRRAGQDKPS